MNDETQLAEFLKIKNQIGLANLVFVIPLELLLELFTIHSTSSSLKNVLCLS